MGVAPGDGAARECRANGGMGNAEAGPDSMQRFAVVITDDRVIDLAIGETPLLDRNTASAEDLQDPGFGDLPSGGELLDGQSGSVGLDDLCSVGGRRAAA
ncbi:hypothetical protein [Nocardia barduliensis]|uniref:hypothetical protein n=1 Tax=Nocardia barduliensis TaxID=2736643 RepID=UPI00157348D5|nr:hypothetical protein [Nocardia barduliensis]